MGAVYALGLALLAVVAAPAAFAQQTSVVFGNTDAQTCYQEARFGVGVSAGLGACDKALRDTLLSRTDRIATLVNRGILLNRAKRYQDAIGDFNTAITLEPRSGEAFLNRGNSHFFLRDFDAALVDYERAIELGTRDLHAAHFNRGLVLEVMARPEEALEAYRRSLEVRPDFLPAAARAEQLAGDIGE